MIDDADKWRDSAAAILNEAKALVERGENVPIEIFERWEAHCRSDIAKQIAEYEAAGDTAGLARVRILEATVDKQMRTIRGEPDNA